ncbi:MAG: divalent-cation tolerance protein CutA [Candidatus Omnitrophota bacterium]
MVLILCTVPNKVAAQRIASVLVDSKLAACVSFGQGLTSIYRWKGKIRKAREVLMLIKANASKYASIEKTIKQKHPYEVPEIIGIEVAKGSREYLRWIKDSCV